MIGSSKNNNISVEDLANNAGTINYEIITRVNSKIKRVTI